MDATTVIQVFLLLSLKHFVIDFPLQTPYQLMNKGTLGHPGGLIHSGLHGLGTYLVLLIFVGWPWAIIAGSVDSFVHYHIDWAKTNINKTMGWKADEHPEFWTLLGLDQLLHSITYIAIIYFLI